jgi:hypothetical protein
VPAEQSSLYGNIPAIPELMNYSKDLLLKETLKEGNSFAF